MKAIIYGKPGCKFCEQAKILCYEQNMEFDYNQLGVDYEREKLSEMVPDFTTFPQIFILSEGGFFEHVGGFTELKEKVG